MNKPCLTIILSIFCVLSIEAQDNDFKTISQIGLKVVDITTSNNEEPTCDFIDSPEGCMGSTSTNATKVPCRIKIIESGNTIYDSGDYEKNVSGATIKINGNTSAYYAVGLNYPYKIKLQKKADLLSRNDNRYEDKDWRLIKDALSLNTIIGLKLSEWMQFSWTPQYIPCNVFINGDYRGCYLLVESVKRNSDCRINVNKNTGYIIERDPYWWNENKYFTSNYFAPNKGYRWTWKYPDEEDVTVEEEAYITQYLNETEQSITTGTYEQFINITSFARWVLAHDILGSFDSGGTNLYISKYDNTNESLLEMPCIWDFDSSYRMTPGTFSRIHTANYDFYFNHLFNSDNKSFTKEYKKLWNELKPTLLSKMIDFIDNYISSPEGIAINTSRIHHFKRWDYGITTIDIADDAIEAKNWFNTHLELLDNNINNINERTAIKHIIYNNTYYKSIYSLSGQRIGNLKKNIYIINGKKYLAK